FHSTNYITANPNSPLSLHDALPISYPAASAAHRCSSKAGAALPALGAAGPGAAFGGATATGSGATRAAAADDRSRVFLLAPWKQDRKSTRLNSSHVKISYAVFCLKK